MPEASLRWEWRSFGQRFGSAEQSLAQLTPSGVKESDEIYLLSSRGDNVKIRDALMDVKVLREVNAAGLEQWAPIMKAGFPLSATDAAKALEALRIAVPEFLQDNYSLDAFLEGAAGEDSGIQVVRVHKRRARYIINGCMAELSDISVNGKSTRTIAVESEDASAVERTLAELGLGGYANVNYPRALTALINDEPDCFAVIDVGTNSVKLHIGARDLQGAWRTLVDRAELTRLGEGLAEAGLIGQAALDRTVAAIADMVDEARRIGVRAIAAVGTAGLRIARNGADITASIRARTGVQVEVISGDDEARLAFLAAVAALGSMSGSLVVFDTGGGSSQFTFGQGAKIQERFSVNAGAARYTERFGLSGAVSNEVLGQAMAAISADLSRLDGRPSPDTLVGMGGAVTNIAAVMHGLADYDPAVIQGTILDGNEIDRQIELYRSSNADARRSIVGLQPKRAEVILAGACIVRTVMRKLGKPTLWVSDRGLRHGVLAERFGF